MNIFALSAEVEGIIDALAFAEMEGDQDAIASLQEALDVLFPALHERIEARYAVATQLMLEARQLREQQEGFAKRARAREKAARRIELGTIAVMEKHDIRSTNTKFGKLSLVRNSVPTVEVEDVNLLPESLVRVKIEKSHDAKAILEFWKEGHPLPEGVKVTYGNHLRLS